MKPIELEQRYYLLGNKTAEHIEGSRIDSVPVNAIVTHSQRREHETEMSVVQVKSEFGSGRMENRMRWSLVMMRKMKG